MKFIKSIEFVDILQFLFVIVVAVACLLSVFQFQNQNTIKVASVEKKLDQFSTRMEKEIKDAMSDIGVLISSEIQVSEQRMTDNIDTEVKRIDRQLYEIQKGQARTFEFHNRKYEKELGGIKREFGNAVSVVQKSSQSNYDAIIDIKKELEEIQKAVRQPEVTVVEVPVEIPVEVDNEAEPDEDSEPELEEAEVEEVSEPRSFVDETGKTMYEPVIVSEDFMSGRRPMSCTPQPDKQGEKQEGTGFVGKVRGFFGGLFD